MNYKIYQLDIMQRNELPLTDQAIIDRVTKIWGFVVHKPEYNDLGTTFAFGLTNDNGKKLFLKIYSKRKEEAHLYNSTPESLRNNCLVLSRLRIKYNIRQMPEIIKTSAGEYLDEFDNFMLVILHYIEGSNPRYEPNELQSIKLATILSDLHMVPIVDFPEIVYETFDIDFAMGFRKWLDIKSVHGREEMRPMLEKLATHKAYIERALSSLEKLCAYFKSAPLDLVLTHGDAHHFNVLQTTNDLYLIDWDDVKIAPRERDLWHYEFTPLTVDYSDLNPKFVLNRDLCAYYRTQRFLDDLRIYIEHETTTKEQAQININYFCNHFGWVECGK